MLPCCKTFHIIYIKQNVRKLYSIEISKNHVQEYIKNFPFFDTNTRSNISLSSGNYGTKVMGMANTQLHKICGSGGVRIGDV